MEPGKKWKIGFTANDRTEHKEEILQIAHSLGLTEVTASLLFQRGYRTPEEARKFLRIEREVFYDPFLLTDMDRLCVLLEEAMEKGETVTVYGDYDADGVTSTAILLLYLRSRGAKADYYLPDRMTEGYGVNQNAIRRLAERGTKVILTCDTGITAFNEATLAASLGITMLITDHHDIQSRLPDAPAVVNPHREGCRYPFQGLCGAGVAFKTVCALEERRKDKDADWLRRLCESYLDLAALGTVADVMPLRDENRLIVSMGLSYMTSSPRPGIRALCELSGSGKTVGAQTIGFTLGPRLNAAGRMASAEKALLLLLAETQVSAGELAAGLCDCNKQRQTEESRILALAEESADAEIKAGNDRFLVLDGEGWHHGVIGIVASRITDKYHLPSFLISFDGETGKGSGRSIEGLNLSEALGRCSDLLLQYGGHEMAAGLTIEKKNLDEFRKRMNEIARNALSEEALVSSLQADMELGENDLTLRQAQELLLLEPCGTDNPLPAFVLKNAELLELLPIGGGKHTKMTVRAGNRSVAAVYFGVHPIQLDYRAGERADLYFQLNLNDFGGNVTPQLVVRDMRHTEEDSARYASALERLKEAENGTKRFSLSEMPDRADFAQVYTLLRRTSGENGTEKSEGVLLRILEGKGVTMVKSLLALAVLEDAGLIRIEKCASSLSDSGSRSCPYLKIFLLPTTEKTDLTSNSLYLKYLEN